MKSPDDVQTARRAPGAHVLQSGVLFRLWAPNATEATLRLNPEGATQDLFLSRGEGGYWETFVESGRPGDRYLFSIGAGFYPDPASRHQPDGVHGASEVVDLSRAWSDDDWNGAPRDQLVFYELHVGTFTTEGTLAAIEPELERLANLGITAVELMPVAQFPGERNWGYDGVYPWSVQDSYGGPKALQKFVDRCHSHGLSAFLDVVYNHLGPEGNYLGQFAPYFTDRYRTPWGDAINFDGPWSDGVREYFIESALSWFRDFHVDGLRLDAVHSIRDHSAYPFLRELADRTTMLEQEIGRTLHLVAESDQNDPILLRSSDAGGYGLDAQWSDDFHHSVHTLLTEETTGYYEDFGAQWHLERALRDVFVYDGRYSEYRKRRHGAPTTELDGSRFVVAIQNHDQVGNRMMGERLGSLVSFEKQKLAAGLLLLSPFTPLIFMGEEWGETRPFLYFTSHADPELVQAVREGRRAEFSSFAWQGEAPDPDDEETFERSKPDRSRAESGEGAMLSKLYRTLLDMRRTDPALLERDRRFTEVQRSGTTLDLIRRSKSGDEILIRFNLGENPVGVPRESTRILASSDPRWTTEGEEPHGSKLAPWGFAVFRQTPADD